GLPGFEVYSLTRNDKILYPHEKHLSIQPGDELLVTGNSERLSYILNHTEVKLKGIEFLSHEKRENLKQYEAVLSPRFPWLGQTVTECHFFEQLNAVVLAIHRHGERITENLNNLQLQEGDNVVLLATERFY